MYIIPRDGQYDRNMWPVMTRLLKFIVVGGSKYVSFISFNRFCFLQWYVNATEFANIMFCLPYCKTERKDRFCAHYCLQCKGLKSCLKLRLKFFPRSFRGFKSICSCYWIITVDLWSFVGFDIDGVQVFWDVKERKKEWMNVFEPSSVPMHLGHL